MQILVVTQLKGGKGHILQERHFALVINKNKSFPRSAEKKTHLYSYNSAGEGSVNLLYL